MEMHQIRYFLAVCEAENFTCAAERCNVSQPALTTAIKKLEAELGGPLLHRERNQIVLTDLGKLTKPHMEQLFNQANAVRDVAEGFRLLRQAPLQLGVMETVGPLCLAGFLARFQHAYPGVEVELHEGGFDEINGRLTEGELDLAVLSEPAEWSGQLRAHRLYRERYVVVFPPGHRFSSFDAIRLQDVSGEPYVDRLACEMRETVLALCQKRDIELYAKFRSEREDWIQGMVMADMGFAFMPEFSITVSGMLTRPLVEPVVERNVCLLSVAGRQHSPAADAFVREARSFGWPGALQETQAV